MCARVSVTPGRPAGWAGMCKVDVDVGGNFCSVLRTQAPVTLKGASASREGIQPVECAAFNQTCISVSLLFFFARACVSPHNCVEEELLPDINRLQMSVCSCFVVFAIQITICTVFLWCSSSFNIHFYRVLFSHVPYTEDLQRWGEVNAFFVFIFFNLRCNTPETVVFKWAHCALSLHGFSAAAAGNQKQNRSICGCICRVRPSL